jgi:hypothetical protein
MPNQGRWWVLGLALVIGLGMMGWVVYGFWKHRAEDAELRASVLVECAARLGGEAACREHLAKSHDDCARLTRTRPGRYSGGTDSPNRDAYLSCVVLGVDEWVAENGRKKQAEARDRAQAEAPR